MTRFSKFLATQHPVLYLVGHSELQLYAGVQGARVVGQTPLPMPDKILVRCRRFGRLGRINGFMDPPRRGGRDLIVLWQGGRDYSLVRQEDVTLAPDATLEEWQQHPAGRFTH